MVSLENAVTARFETGGDRFEILVDPVAAQNYMDGNEIDWEEVWWNVHEKMLTNQVQSF